MITLNYRDTRPIHEQIRSGMVRLLSTGVISPDEKLPSVRELATQLSINPNTIQKAYAWLETEGYIYTIAGRGSFASPDGAKEKRRMELENKLKDLLKEMKEVLVTKDEIISIVEKQYDSSAKEGGEPS